jgi:Na+-translocating ferredoxin:NAD+ oxidoreductase subunit B
LVITFSGKGEQIMKEEAYQKLAKVLDTLPNGFPATDTGLEIKLLKKIFRPEDAELFCDLRLDFETAQQISERTGRPLEGLESHLLEMQKRGQIFGIDFGGVHVFKMMPWAFGIYEFQLPHLDREMAALCEEFMGAHYVPQFLKTKLPLMHIVPVEKKIPAIQQAMPYEQVSRIIESSLSFAVCDCICKKQKHLLRHGCNKPLEVCMAFAPVPELFTNIDHYRVLSKEEALDILAKAEAAGLVHMTWNIQGGHYFICNCCGCCCPNLEAINKLGSRVSEAVNSSYFALINLDECNACGVCKDERCPVNAIEQAEGSYSIIAEKCIGCGLCATTCPVDAISLVRKKAEDLVAPPANELEWYLQRADLRGVDISKYK